jgi:acetolactate synthase small subunit
VKIIATRLVATKTFHLNIAIVPTQDPAGDRVRNVVVGEQLFLAIERQLAVLVSRVRVNDPSAPLRIARLCRSTGADARTEVIVLIAVLELREVEVARRVYRGAHVSIWTVLAPHRRRALVRIVIIF